MKAVESKIREYLLNTIDISDIGIDEGKEKLGMDSLDDVEFVMWLEDEFDLDITDEEAEKWANLRDVVAYVESNI
tara:strand:- start:1022 stop:1246 length:225 start_codon:yes stop_codon:yes gene_type:complete